ncbi:hypothetical protein L3Y34_009028 [Caenorhabditis briggsae]|uniref:Uncharacterized protein n=1 Tax=Caenorhabditis briggsae TaxID=6238 RepID=A0AAE9A431_CAEBR|nr:hypothetical protein L3Y34_009028 [Caenorhabditis briggsae]
MSVGNLSGESVLIMNARESTGDAEDALSQLIKIIDDNEGKNRVLIFCEDTKCRKLVLTLYGKRIESNIFIEEMHTDKRIVEEEIKKFDRSKVAVCSYAAFKLMNLPLVEKYVFLELPTWRKSTFSKTLKSIEKLVHDKDRKPHLEIFLQPKNDLSMTKSVFVEMKERRAIPIWLEDFIIKTFGTPELRQRYLERKAEKAKQNNTITSNNKEIQTEERKLDAPRLSETSSTSESNQSSVNPPVERPERVREEPFDIHNMQPNAQGNYVIPARFIAASYLNGGDEDGEECADDDNYSEDDYDYNEDDMMDDLDYE